MASSMWIAIGIIAVVAIVGDTIVKIVKQAGGTSKIQAKVAELRERVEDLEMDLGDSRKRIEVLEKIVTNQKYDLGRRIDDLAAGE